MPGGPQLRALFCRPAPLGAEAIFQANDPPRPVVIGF